LRIVFLGTPAFAVPTLDALAREHEIALVVAQPDKPSGRGLQTHVPEVAVRARELGLPLLQPAKIRDPVVLDEIARLAPDLGVVIAYGKILPASLLAMPRHGFVNVHASLLPRYRGAAPIQRAIENGESETGVTIMRVDEQLDHGPMLETASLAIGTDEHTPALAARLSVLGAETLVRLLRDFAAVRETPQDEALATFAPKIEKQEGEVRWSEPARKIYDRYRAFDPWPGLFTRDGIKLTELHWSPQEGKPGEILAVDDGVTIAAGSGSLRVTRMQRPGKARAAAGDVARGLGWRRGDVLA
jgi:methionyl-tRNA formyltransferase